MAIFPFSPKPIPPYEWKPIFSTILGGPYGAGNVVARSERPYPLHAMALTWARRHRVDLLPIINFFRSQRGRAGRFTFVDYQGWNDSPVGVQWDDVYVCVATAGQTDFVLPFTSGTSHVLKKNGVAIDGADVTFGTTLTSDPEEGRDTAVLDPGPGAGVLAGDVFTCSARALLALYTRFTSDELPVEVGEVDLVKLSLAVIEDRTG